MPARRKTAGERVVAQLTAALKPGFKWSHAESITLDQIRISLDRAEVLTGLLGAELAKDQVSTRRVTEVSAEIRQLQAGALKLVQGMDPQAENIKSARHVKAANERWRLRSVK